MRARQALRSVLVLPLAAAILGACGATGSGSGTGGGAASLAAPAASNPVSPAGGPMIGDRTFVSTQVIGHQLVAGTRVTLAFRDATLSASAGCNTMGGEYHILGDALSVGDLSMTEMGCQPDLMAQDDWLAKLLPGATVRFGDTSLTLAKGAVTMTLVDRKTTNLPLEGTVWTVDGLLTGDAVSSAP
ncbi:MAG TPA: META domain-containing protein, partial [Candidatus Limnocylindrales bacterium]